MENENKKKKSYKTADYILSQIDNWPIIRKPFYALPKLKY